MAELLHEKQDFLNNGGSLLKITRRKNNQFIIRQSVDGKVWIDRLNCTSSCNAVSIVNKLTQNHPTKFQKFE